MSESHTTPFLFKFTRMPLGFGLLILFSLISFFISVNQVFAQATPPTGTSPQTFCEGATVAQLVAGGTNILWYDVSTGGTSLAESVALVDEQTYYASQTDDTGESTDRLAVTVVINFVTGGTIGNDQTYCWEGSLNSLNELTASTGTATSLSYRWDARVAEEGWAAITFGTNKDYDSKDILLDLSGAFVTVYYRRVTTSLVNGRACTAESNPITIQQDLTAPVPNATTLATLYAECSIEEPPAPTATDNCEPAQITSCS